MKLIQKFMCALAIIKHCGCSLRAAWRQAEVLAQIRRSMVRIERVK